MNPADCRVAAVDAVVLRAAQLAADDLEAAQDTVLVRVRDEAGLIDVGDEPGLGIIVDEQVVRTRVGARP